MLKLRQLNSSMKQNRIAKHSSPALKVALESTSLALFARDPLFLFTVSTPAAMSYNTRVTSVGTLPVRVRLPLYRHSVGLFSILRRVYLTKREFPIGRPAARRLHGGMELAVAANYEFDLVPRLAEFPVREVYGKFPADAVGGGRPSYMGTPLTKDDLAAYVAILDHHGIAFNYLLNSACLGNREWSRRWQKKLLRLLDRLGTMGVRRLTVATPYLLERVKGAFPEFYVKAGIYAQIDTPRRARFWRDLGADAVTLESFSINRHFPLLRAIRAAVGGELQLIANHPCLPNCALQPYHQNGFAHSSDGSHRLFLDYCFLTCTLKRLEDPSLLIKAGWIRPEDIGFYEALGFTHFKLLERDIPSAELLKRVKAYSQRRFTGNLAELILPYGFRQAPEKRSFWLLRHFFRPGQVNPLKLRPLYALMKSQGMLFASERNPFHIDAAKIPADFLRGFEQRCCAWLSCDDCRYCEEVAKQAVTIDPVFQREQLARLKEARQQLVDGRLWHV
jgi:collagenase-like PrtC family protease